MLKRNLLALALCISSLHSRSIKNFYHVIIPGITGAACGLVHGITNTQNDWRTKRLVGSLVLVKGLELSAKSVLSATHLPQKRTAVVVAHEERSLDALLAAIILTSCYGAGIYAGVHGRRAVCNVARGAATLLSNARSGIERRIHALYLAATGTKFRIRQTVIGFERTY